MALDTSNGIDRRVPKRPAASLGIFLIVNLYVGFQINKRKKLSCSTAPAAEIVKQDYDVVVTWGTLAVSSIQKRLKLFPS